MSLAVKQKVRGGQSRKRLPVNSLAAASAITAGLLAIPILVIVAHVFTGNADVWVHLSKTVLPEYLKNSFGLAAGVSAGVLVIGVSTAWITTQYSFPGSRVFSVLLMLPMAFPAYIIAYSYTGLLDFAGPVQSWIRSAFNLRYGQYWFPEIRSLGGAVWMLIFVLYPYVFLMTRAAFLEQSANLSAASRSLGLNGFKTFWKVNLPIARPAIVTGLSLVLMETLADYGTVQYFGVPTFTTGIFRTFYGLGNAAAAAQLATLLLGFVVLLIVLEKYSRRKQQYFNKSESRQRAELTRLGGMKALAAFLCCAVPVLLGFIIPVLMLLIWCFQNLAQFDAAFVSLAWNSFSLAAIAAVVAIVMSLALAYSNRLNSTLWSRVAIQTVSTGYALPGVIIAIGVMISLAWFDHRVVSAVGDLIGVDFGLLFSGTLVALIFAYSVRFMAMPLGACRNALAQIKPSVDQSARSLGKTPLQTIRLIHVPLLRGSLLTAFLMVFVDVLKELPATLILRPFNFNTLAVRAYELASDERLFEAAPASLMIVVVGLIPVYLLTSSIVRRS
ncbi:ABC transporter permease [Reinekea marinisedimentorum]|uniref:ABC transporter permease n=1 Tax=Reinekea marinisedimentorum TaxID=230495 RepID=UPI001FB28F16|nr:iron ABC transporter permease [Reinekea marinisedimentorum]